MLLSEAASCVHRPSVFGTLAASHSLNRCSCVRGASLRAPARKEALLDLIVSDVGPPSVDVLVAQMADHNAVLAKFYIAMAEATVVQRIVFDYAKANWAELSRDFNNCDWAPMYALDVDSAERFFHRSTLAILRQHVPEREL